MNDVLFEVNTDDWFVHAHRGGPLSVSVSDGWVNSVAILDAAGAERFAAALVEAAAVVRREEQA